MKFLVTSSQVLNFSYVLKVAIMHNEIYAVVENYEDLPKDDPPKFSFERLAYYPNKETAVKVFEDFRQAVLIGKDSFQF